MVVAASADHPRDMVVGLSIACWARALAQVLCFALSNLRDVADHLGYRWGPMDLVQRKVNGDLLAGSKRFHSNRETSTDVRVRD